MPLQVFTVCSSYQKGWPLSLIIFSCSGWATAELVMTRLVPLWVGARGVEFDWKYIQMSFDANVSLVSRPE